MNIDLITKLAKLANNNPSEHEANAAARKVCRLLAEANFKFQADPVVNKSYQAPQTPPRPTRKTEPERNPYRGSAYNTPFDQYFRDTFYGGARGGKNSFRDGAWNNPFEDERDKKKEDFERVCSRCNLKVKTYSKEEPFICKICKDKIRNIYECPKCKSHGWVLSVITDSYFCTFCSYEVTQREADANKWRMK